MNKLNLKVFCNNYNRNKYIKNLSKINKTCIKKNTIQLKKSNLFFSMFQNKKNNSRMSINNSLFILINKKMETDTFKLITEKLILFINDLALTSLKFYFDIILKLYIVASIITYYSIFQNFIIFKRKAKFSILWKPKNIKLKSYYDYISTVVFNFAHGLIPYFFGILDVSFFISLFVIDLVHKIICNSATPDW